MQVCEDCVILVEGLESTSVDVSRGNCHSALVTFREILEGLIKELEGIAVIQAPVFGQTTFNGAFTLPKLPDLFVSEVGPSI